MQTEGDYFVVPRIRYNEARAFLDRGLQDVSLTRARLRWGVTVPWDPEQYRRFQNERFAPFDDLIRLIEVRGGQRVVDLGCGTGELTSRLQELLPDSAVLGIDSSPQMLARAQPLTRPGSRMSVTRSSTRGPPVSCSTD